MEHASGFKAYPFVFDVAHPEGKRKTVYLPDSTQLKWLLHDTLEPDNNIVDQAVQKRVISGLEELFSKHGFDEFKVSCQVPCIPDARNKPWLWINIDTNGKAREIFVAMEAIFGGRSVSKLRNYIERELSIDTDEINLNIDINYQELARIEELKETVIDKVLKVYYGSSPSEDSEDLGVYRPVETHFATQMLLMIQARLQKESSARLEAMFCRVPEFRKEGNIVIITRKDDYHLAAPTGIEPAPSAFELAP